MPSLAQDPRASKVLRAFCRHLVGLCVRFRVAGEEKDRFSAFSGTLIIILGRVHFLSAGHVLAAIDELRTSQSVTISSAVLADTFGPDPATDFPIPFDLAGARLFYQDVDGLDFGVMALDPYYVRLLAANGVVAIEEKHWAKQPELSFGEGYLMLGLPDEFASKTVDDDEDPIVSPTMFPITRLAAPPVDRAPAPNLQFVGQIPDEIDIDDIVGMSGGPIFGFNGDQTVYWIVALQSSWLPNRRIVFASLLPTFANLMIEWARDEQGSG